MKGAHRRLGLQLGDITTPPDNAHRDAVRRQAVQHDFVDQAAQQGLLVRPGPFRLSPEGGQLRAEREEVVRSSGVSVSGRARAARRWASASSARRSPAAPPPTDAPTLPRPSD